MTVFLLKKRINEFTFTRPFSYVRVYLSAGLRHKCPLYNTRHRNSLTPYTAEAIIVPHRSAILTVSRITHDRGNGRRPNMVGMDKG